MPSIRHRRPVSLSLLALDLPTSASVETAATIYENDCDRFHILLAEPALNAIESSLMPGYRPPDGANATGDRSLWLELSPQRAVLTMQSGTGFHYRHLWEKGVYGISRYWLQEESGRGYEQIRLRNFTRCLTLSGRPVPDWVRLEYELWSQNLPLGRYVLNLEIF
ncbi:MAG: hypothetical protein EA001_05650 [Oscillatoriales cyanobacterium]|nr:MAG: hypothetical protein EA001_05650 [Oscillatoriales cyanobacterium]